jgi:hypothetical protein
VLEAADSWGYDLASLKARPSSSPSLLLFHGNADTDVPPSASQYIVDHCFREGDASHFVDGENHTMIRRAWRNILVETVKVGTAVAS